MNVRNPLLRRLIHGFRQSPGMSPDEGKAVRTLRRREFLQGLTLAGAGVITGCAGPGSSTKARNTPGEEVVIVGGGIAGLTAAWRLQQRGVTVHLYEASRRTGGRMWTRRGFNADAMFCELGGELVDTDHRALIRLAKELGVGIQSLTAGREPAEEYYYMGGKIRTDADLISAFAPLARRIAADASGLYTPAGDFTAKARAFDKVSLQRYLREAARTTGTAAWLIETLDVAYTTEYGMDTAEQSSLNFIDLIGTDTTHGFKVYGDSDEAWRIQGGSGTLPEELARRLTGRIRVHDGHRLTEISSAGGGRLNLTFAHGAGQKTVTAGRVILALPFTMLRGVSGIHRLPLSAAKHRAIQELGYGQSAKVMFGFHDRFWRRLTPRSNGGVFSDAVFEAWETSQKQPGVRGVLTCFIGGRAARRFSPASPPAYLDRLDGIFPGARAAFDGNRAHMDWTHYAFSRGSFSSPRTGQYCGMVADAAAAELDGRLIFAGEHTSEESPGFMNGGVESGERAAREVLAALT